MTDDAALKLQNLLKLQPHIITNDRLKRPNFPGDTKTPEQRIPGQAELATQDWETCMTMNGSWGYKSWDHNWKPVATLIRNLVDIASKGGNYLLNIGPKEDGSVPQESVERLEAIGKWMRVNGKAIYATQANPLQDLPWGRCTMQKIGNTTLLNLFVFNWPKEGRLKVPGVSNKLIRASLLANNKKLKARRSNGNIVIEVPAVAPDSIATVVQLYLKGAVSNAAITNTKEMKTGALD